MKRKISFTRPMALLLSFSMMAGVCPAPVLAAELERPAAVQAATPEQAAPAEDGDTQTPSAPEQPEEIPAQAEFQEPAPDEKEPVTVQPAAVPSLLTAEALVVAPAVGDTITINGIGYEVTRAATADRNGALTLTDGTDYSGDLVLADGIEYAGGKYDVTDLAANAFSGNTALTSVDMTDSSVSSIGQSCFKGCTALTNVQFAADTITNMMKSGVFSGCTSLTRLTIPSLNLSTKYSNSAFSGSSIQELTVYTLSGNGFKAYMLNNMPDGFTLNLPNDISSSALEDTTFGSTQNVTLNLGTQEDVDHYTTVFEGKDVKVQLFGGEAEALVFVTGIDGTMTGYATLNDAINAINDSEDSGPFQIRTASTGSTVIKWEGNVAPNKPTTIDFSGASVDLPDTLTLQAPLTIENITNINSGDDTLTTLTAGTYAFTMVDGGSFGFAAISGSDLTFDGTLPGGRFGGGEQVQLTGTDEAAKVTFVNIGRSDYYYDLPLMSGFETLALDGAYLEADGSDIFKGQLDGVTAVELQNGGLELNAAAEIETLSGNGELRLAEGATLTVTRDATGSFQLPEFTGTDLTGSGLTLPTGSDVTLTNGKNAPVTVPQPVVQVKGLGQYATMADAFAAIKAGDADSYTITLLDDVTLEATDTSGASGVVELPAKALTIQGDGHTLSAGGTTRNYVYAAADLTLDNVKLNMPKTYLRITGEGATVTVEGSVTGELEKIDANVSTGCTVLVKAPVSDAVIDGIAGTSKNKMTVILQGYGSLDAPATKTAFPTISNNSGTLVLENSWLVADNAANWGSIEVRQGGGLSLTGSIPNASVKGWKVADGVVADLTVKNGKLTVNGAVSGKTKIHFSGDDMTAEGKVPVKAAQADLGAFALAEPLNGLTLLPDADGNYTLVPLTVKDPAVTVSGGSLGNGVQFASWDEATAVLQNAADNETYTVTLKKDLTLPASTLPDTTLVIDGAGRTLSLDEGDTLQVQNSLTLQNVKLDMDGATLTYTGSGSKKEVVFKNTVTGMLSYISDTSGARYLSIVLEDDSFVFETITGTTTDDNLQNATTTLYLTGFGSEEDPVDLYNKVVDLSAIELDNCWLTASGDATYLGVVRTASANSQGALTLTGDTTLAGFGLKENGKFEVRMPANATLTVTEKYSRQYPVVLTLTGTAEDGHLLINAPEIRKETAFAIAGQNETVKLCWNSSTRQFTLSYPPVIAMSDEAMKYNDAYTKVVLALSDAQGIDSVEVNGTKDSTFTAGDTSYTPDVALLKDCEENTVKATDATGNQTTFNFTYESPADYTKVEEALGKVPADLSGYTDESVQALQQALDAVKYGYGHTGQSAVDAMAQAVLDAVAALEPAETESSGNGQQSGSGNSGSGSSSGGNNTTSQAAATPAPAVAPAAQAAVTAVPRTADTEEPALWAALALLSLGGLAGLTLLRRRKQ